MSRLKLSGISKSFPGVKALDNISLEVAAGEVHAICGENGAGKSTLMNVLSGNLRPDDGTIELDGTSIAFESPRDAFARGISIVYQHLSLSDNLSVAENLFANQHPVGKFGFIDYTKLHRLTADVLYKLNIKLQPTEQVGALSQAQKQMVEIGKALVRNPRVLILDEPTASLTDVEIRVLFDIIHSLKQQGVSILYISHRIQELFQVADCVSVLKDGTYQGTFPIGDLTRETLIRRMVGRELIAHKRSGFNTSHVLLEVDELSGGKFSGISFTLHKGEILGLAGLVGAGRTEIVRVLFGIDNQKSGTIRLNGAVISSRHPADAVGHGLAYVPEDRKTLGLFTEMSIAENLIAASFTRSKKRLIDREEAHETTRRTIEKLHIICRSQDEPVGQLSGGNQQKVLLGKWLSLKPSVLILDEPTHGVDVGAKQEIHGIIKALADSGIGVIMISSELPELLGVCHRLVVVRDGMVAGALDAEEATEETIMALATQ